MAIKSTFLTPKQVLVELHPGESFILGFHSDYAHQLEQMTDQFLEFVSRLFEKFYHGDESVIMGEINRQLMIHNCESIFYYHRDKVKNRVLIGERIRYLREQRMMPLFQLAGAAGIDESNLRRIEQGKYSASFDVLCCIASALNMKIDFVEL